MSSQEEKAADEINKLSTEIYQLSTTVSELQTLTDTYDELDRKIIKTTEDQEAMNTALEEAADKMTEEQKKVYELLATNQQKIEYIKRIKAENSAKIEEDRQAQLDQIKQNASLLTGNSDEAQTVQSAVYKTSNQYLYDRVDEKGYDTNTETLTQKILEGMSVSENYLYATNKDKINNLVDQIDELGIAETLLSSSSSLTDVVNAYNSTSGAIRSLLQNIYPQLETLSTWGNDLLT